MTIFLILVGSAIAVGMAVALWRLTGPGKRLRLGAGNLYYTPAVTADAEICHGKPTFLETRIMAVLSCMVTV
ncbi:MAG TPA: hypothetical protein DDY78_12775 [Planctomycetales bacterium]|jgi:hypothetical protein|nr:hypothetical protein [Planctomycetales bacterium]